MREYIGTIECDEYGNEGSPIIDENQEIVRCRDCVDYDCGRCYSDQWSTASLMPAHRVEPDGFCAWGEKRVE